MSSICENSKVLFCTYLYSTAKTPPERDEIKVVQDDFAARIHLRSEIPVFNRYIGMHNATNSVLVLILYIKNE